MKRECTRCRRPYTPDDLAEEESRGMEAERQEAGLEGVRFLCYRCPGCGTDDLFVDLLRLDGESPGDFERRREEMEAVVRQLHAGRARAVVVPVKKPEPSP
jgi:hypothetical protein